MIEQQSRQNKVIVRSFNNLQIEPDPIYHMFYCQQQDNLYVSRQKSTEVYHITQTQSQTDFHHIAQLPWSKYVVKINSVIMLFCPFQLQLFLNNSWEIHPFTTQLLSIKVKKISQQLSFVYSFHQQQTAEYRISNNQNDQDFVMNFLSYTKTPFHVTKQNIVEGFGKKIDNVTKSAPFTVCDFKNQDYIVIGDTEGSLHIYDFKTLGHLKSFSRHLGPILTIKIYEEENIVFFTGSDSKIVGIRRINDQWELVGELRGQSHDVFSLELINQTLISGGLTTDICCYRLNKQGDLLFHHQNKVSYCSEKRIHSMRNYILINKLTSFELWRIRQSASQLDYIISYQLSANKHIMDIKISKKQEDNTYLIVLSSQIETVGWKFNEENGLIKLFTIKNSYQFIEFLIGKTDFVGIRDTGDIEIFSAKNGKILNIIHSQIILPTHIKLINNHKLIVASNLSYQLKIYDLKLKTILSTLRLTENYQVICQKNPAQFLIKYVNDKSLYSCNFTKKVVEQTPILEFPSQSAIIYQGGIIAHQSKITKKIKKYWYFAYENKVVLVSNLNNKKKKKIRSIYTKRIGGVIKPRVNKNFQIGLVHLNFKRMINNMQIKPLISKKIV